MDHNKIIQIVTIRYIFKTVKMVLIISIFAYFIGIFSFIVFELIYRNQMVSKVNLGIAWN
jgi:hypothetical protein